MTDEDGRRPRTDDPFGGGDPPEDGPVIDPRDPLGLGDLPADTDDTSARRHLDAEADTLPTDAEGDVDGDVDVDGDGDLPPAADVLADPSPVPDVDSPARAGPGAAAGRDATDPGGDAGGDASQPAGASAPAAAPTAPGPTVRSGTGGWARLGHAMRPRTTQGQLITAGLCALLGFALVVQVRQATDTQLGALRQNDLVRLLDETTTRTDELEQESVDLQRERDELLSGSDRQQAALDAARRNAAMQGILTGRLPATGPGVRITLTEPDGGIRPATMLHVLEELRNAGAEAMELNGHRITTSSAFTGTRGGVVLDGQALVSPFRWTVIGDPDTIAPALEIPGGALVRVRADGGRGTVEKSDRVDVTAVRTHPAPVHATPVEGVED